MQDSDALLERAETYIHHQTGEYLSDLQRIVLLESLSDNPKRKTYDQIATETGYSSKYIKQVVAPQTWQLLSDVTGQRVLKSNVRNILIPLLGNLPPSTAEPLSAVSESLTPNSVESDPDSNVQPDDTHRTSRPDHALTQEAQTPDSQTERSRLDLGEKADDSEGADNIEPYPEPTPLAASDPSEESADAIKASKAVILLVDDQPQNLALLSDMLENEGYEVRQAINGALALKAATMNPPDIILLDVNMPQMDGYEVCRQLKAEGRTETIPVIFVSALHETWDKVKAFSVGGSDYMTKPLKVMEVMARIENQLKIQRSRHQLRCLTKQVDHTHRILADMGVLDPVMGLINRTHFDTVLRQYWDQALHAQQSISLILCQINESSLVAGSIVPSGDFTDAELVKSPIAWPLLAQTILMAVEHTNPILASYDANPSGQPSSGAIAILLPNADLNQRKAIAQTIETALADYGQSMALAINIGGTSLVPNNRDAWQSLIERAEETLQPIKQQSVDPNFQAWPL